MNADRHAELRAVAEEGWDTRPSAVLRLLDEVAELRRGLERVEAGEVSTDQERTVAAVRGRMRGLWTQGHVVASATLARADAIGGGE